MNINLGGVLILATGAILLYGAVKNKNPTDVVKEALGNKPAAPAPAVDPNNPAKISADANRAANYPGGANFIGPVSPYPSN